MKRVASDSNWRTLRTKRKYKKLLPRRTSMFGARTLINQTDSTRKVWDPTGYKAQKFYDNMYRKL